MKFKVPYAVPPPPSPDRDVHAFEKLSLFLDEFSPLLKTMLCARFNFSVVNFPYIYVSNNLYHLHMEYMSLSRFVMRRIALHTNNFLKKGQATCTNKPVVRTRISRTLTKKMFT